MVQAGSPSSSGAEARGQKVQGHLGNGINFHFENENEKKKERQLSSPCLVRARSCCILNAAHLPVSYFLPGLALSCDTSLGDHGLLPGSCQPIAGAPY